MTTIQTTPIPFNYTAVLPGLKDLLNQLKQDILLTLNCHAVGTIQSFDAIHQTATATVNYQKTYFILNPETQQFQPQLVNYPTLMDCPVLFSGGGPTVLTFPVTVGDECLVLFNDRDMDNWFAGSTTAGVATPRLHSFSDGLIIVGIRSLPNVLGDFDTVRSVLRAGKTHNSITAVGVNPSTSKVLVTNTYPGNSTTLNTLIQDLVTELQNLITAIQAITVTSPIVVPSTPFSGSSTSGTPNNNSSFSTISSNLTTTATQLGDLLE